MKKLLFWLACMSVFALAAIQPDSELISSIALAFALFLIAANIIVAFLVACLWAFTFSNEPRIAAKAHFELIKCREILSSSPVVRWTKVGSLAAMMILALMPIIAVVYVLVVAATRFTNVMFLETSQ